MKRTLTLLTALFLTASAGWGQEAPKRVHTRPPYSGPRKAHGKFIPPPSPAVRAHKGGLPKPKSDHIVVR